MKNIKLAISAFAVLAVVGSALAFKPAMKGQGSVYCNSSCNTNSRIDFRVAGSTTTNTDPCGNGAGKEYVLAPSCTEVDATQTVFFEPVSN